MVDDIRELDNLSPMEQRWRLRREQENETLIFELLKNSDMDGFELALRDGRDVSLRARAADALGECYEVSAVPLLARCCIEEPDNQVREKAYISLKNLMGERVDQVIASHRQQRHAKEPWLIGIPMSLNPLPGQDTQNPDDEEKSLGGETDIYTLFSQLQNSSDEESRLKAIRSLEQVPDQRGKKALIAIAEFGQFDDDRELALEALQLIYGDQLNSVLLCYEEDVKKITPATDVQPPASLDVFQPQDRGDQKEEPILPAIPSILEEKMGIIQVILLGMLGLVIVAILFLLLMMRWNEVF
jgi:hypothetical protein